MHAASIFLLALPSGKPALSVHRAPRTRGAGFTRNDTALDKLGKLQALLATRAKSDEDTSLLADLLSISTESLSPILNLSPKRLKERTFDTLIRRLETLATDRPVLMLVEDAHWADPSSVELFDLTIEHLVGAPRYCL
jgi:predicted ATPase